MFSHGELRRAIELALAPTHCRCTITSGGIMTIEVGDPEDCSKSIVITGISTARLVSGQAIMELAAEIKQEIGGCRK